MMIEAASLALTGIRHAFFTRAGGVSGGFYASLNGGIGSRDAAAQCRAKTARAWRRRSASSRAAFSPPIRSTRRRSSVAETPWTQRGAPARRRHRHAHARARHRRDHRRLRAGAARRSAGAASSAPRMPAGAARLSGVIEATVAAMERLGAARGQIRAAIGPMIRQANYEVGPDLIARFAAEDRASNRFFSPAPRDGHALFDLGGYVAARLDAGRRRPRRGSRALHLCRSGAVFQLPPRHPSRRGRLRPARQCDRADRLERRTARSRHRLRVTAKKPAGTRP